MLTKSELRLKLTEELESRNVPDADEIADTVVETLDEDGAFEIGELDE
jgi:hypothetical protein